MKNTKRDKCIENFLLAFSVGFLILWFGSTISILIFSDGITSNWDYMGFNGFQEIFSFPIKSLVGAATLFGMYLAYKNFKYQENQLEQTKRAYKASIQPFISLKSLKSHFKENDGKLTISIETINTGKYPGIITSILLSIKKQDSIIFEDRYIQKEFIIFPNECKPISPTFNKLPERNLFDINDIAFDIQITYKGIDAIHTTNTKYNYIEKKYSEIDSNWTFDIDK